MKKIGLFGSMMAVAACAPEQKPNIVFFFADDIGAECFGCYGGAEYETPFIDSLAAPTPGVYPNSCPSSQ